MPLVLYNSLTHRKEVFAPLDPERVRLYVCGPTVYDRAHIGNARSNVVFDQLCRLLRAVYGAGHVTYVRNITDVDDKIIDAARANGESIAALTARTTADYHADMAALGSLPPDIEPRATAYIPQMTALIERLIAEGHAYVVEGNANAGHVLFSVATASGYGKLSRRSQDEMIAGARVEVAPYKRDPGDFVLWKPSTDDQPGWDSPWGRGRPGWHIECSAMSEANLGETFDIHGGGLDLIFPHHENEIAQSEGAHCGRPLARVWMHNEMLTVDGIKMSKSLGNIRTVRELLSEWNGEVIRLTLLSTHYRDPLDWTQQKLDQAVAILDRFYAALALDGEADLSGGSSEVARQALEDDLNTPLAFSKMHEIMSLIYSTSDERERKSFQKNLKACGILLGILQHPPQNWRHGRVRVVFQASIPFEFSAARPQGEAERKIQERVNERTQARRERRFADADRIRTELSAEGIILEDKSDGTTTWWRKD